ncbi:MAG TPA: hypothetical protein VE727_04570 [Solirubrobacterales bacterium]|nr:hypothetical protein [Solirubrobacterales bacterium]
MSTPRVPVRSRPALALAGAAAVLTAAIGAAGPAGAAGSTTIRSGAGPGWPKTLHPSDFVRRVDNPWFPLKPGSKWRYRGREGHSRFRDKMRVTHRTKRIEGVRATVVHDVVLKRGKPREVTNDWYAQDRHRNVWYFGENTRELDRHGHVKTREGTWKTGRDGARPGILFPGQPRVGQKARQEYYKGHAEDHFKILDVDAHVSTPYVSTHHAVRTKEWTPLEPGVVDNKYYVRRVGDVKEKTVKGGTERLRLVSFHRG